MDKLPHFYAKDRTDWRSWLEENHRKESSVWLVFDKGKSRTMSWQDIVEEALCFGWIDGRAGKVSETQSKIYVSKRKPNSVWSKINKLNVQKLIESGKMTKSGLRSVEIAKQNGSWNALDKSDNLIYPAELIDLFNNQPAAQENFEKFPIGARRNILQWIYDAKTEKTKTDRINKTFEAANNNIRLR